MRGTEIFSLPSLTEDGEGKERQGQSKDVFPGLGFRQAKTRVV